MAWAQRQTKYRPGSFPTRGAFVLQPQVWGYRQRLSEEDLLVTLLAATPTTTDVMSGRFWTKVSGCPVALRCAAVAFKAA